ncbi:MAG: aspartate carbamoyltransferase regulatory subunit [Chloroflexi bacterium]|nr:aspartate carbamoyltransferase regulatory subunit [Chloroflexota bacterium]
MTEKVMKVQPIRNGTVIDHIIAGKGVKIMDLLGFNQEGTAILSIMNVKSKKLGRKDIIKIEDRELSEEDINKIALLSPRCNINIIRNYTVSEKIVANVPKVNVGIAKCNNQNCISNNQRSLESKLELKNEDELTLRCMYCKRGIKGSELVFA